MKIEITNLNKIDLKVGSVSESLRRPSLGLSRQVIEMALLQTPTGGNSKPFEWNWKNDELIIDHNSKHAAHYLNRNNHTSWIALGCLIESVQIAARSQDWKANVKVSENALTARIFFTSAQTSSEYIPRLSALLERATYRGSLSASEQPEIYMHHENTSNEIQVKVAADQDLTKAFKKFVTSSETYIWLQKKASLAFFGEVRFFDNRKNLRGIRSKDLGINKVDELLLYSFSFIPWILSFIVSVPLLNFSFKQASKKNLKNAHFVLITSKSLQSSHLLNVGEAAMRLWVDLEMQGYVVQPYSMASITLVDAATNQLPKDTLKKFKTLFTEIGPEVLQQQFNLQDNEQPVWLFRVGRR